MHRIHVMMLFLLLTKSCYSLTLDVYVPKAASKRSRLPVKVWQYGGCNQAGGTSYPLYDACHLATDAIVVEFNYRVGPLGWLSLETAGVQGNMAIQDILMALQWVQDNIENFGGDKSKVMLFGQSAGADNTFTVSTLPEAKGLIHSAILESGGGQVLLPFQSAQTVGASFAEVLNCHREDVSPSHDDNTLFSFANILQ